MAHQYITNPFRPNTVNYLPESRMPYASCRNISAYTQLRHTLASSNVERLQPPSPSRDRAVPPGPSSGVNMGTDRYPMNRKSASSTQSRVYDATLPFNKSSCSPTLLRCLTYKLGATPNTLDTTLIIQGLLKLINPNTRRGTVVHPAKRQELYLRKTSNERGTPDRPFVRSRRR